MENRTELSFLGNYPQYEVDFITSLLKSYDIPVVKEEPGTGEYMEIYMGYNAYGVEIYVPHELLEKAKEILKAENIKRENTEVESMDEDSIQVEDKAKNMKVETTHSEGMKEENNETVDMKAGSMEKDKSNNIEEVSNGDSDIIKSKENKRGILSRSRNLVKTIILIFLILTIIIYGAEILGVIKYIIGSIF